MTICISESSPHLSLLCHYFHSFVHTITTVPTIKCYTQHIRSYIKYAPQNAWKGLWQECLWSGKGRAQILWSLHDGLWDSPEDVWKLKRKEIKTWKQNRSVYARMTTPTLIWCPLLPTNPNVLQLDSICKSYLKVFGSSLNTQTQHSSMEEGNWAAEDKLRSSLLGARGSECHALLNQHKEMQVGMQSGHYWLVQCHAVPHMEQKGHKRPDFNYKSMIKDTKKSPLVRILSTEHCKQWFFTA